MLSGLLVLCMVLSLMPVTVMATETANSADLPQQHTAENTPTVKSPITRLAGDDRFQTAFAVADAMKAELGIEKFDAVIVASGTNFADALSGSYLAAVKNAPILLSCNNDFNPKYVEKFNNMLIDYVKGNLVAGGKVYILGGEKAVLPAIDEALAEYNVVRLAGSTRYETNIRILEEAGIAGKDVLICNGDSFADSLSASATELPILLVNSKYGLIDMQKDFLETCEKDFYIIGGTTAVSAAVEEQIAEYGAAERIGGKNRFETSVLIAEKFFDDPESIVLAYGWNFPDGLCGGSLAAAIGAPLVLTMTDWEASAAEYAAEEGISSGYVLGSGELISDSSVDLILKNQPPEDIIPEETVPEETVPEETVPKETEPDETEPEVREKTFLPDRSADFTFLVSCEQGEEYLRKNLILTGENGAIAYIVTVEEEGLYRIAATEHYQQYQTYHVQGAGDMLFPEYNAKALDFSIIGPDRAEIEFNEDNLIFLKTLELEQYGTSGMYDLQWDEAAQRYYLTLFELKGIEPSMVGKVFGIGDYVNTEDILADSTRELYFAKLEKISHNAEDDLLLELSVPQLSEVYDKLDIYFSAGTGGTQINGDPEQAFTDAVVTSEGFTEYLATAHMAAESYAESYGLVAEPVAAASKDNLKFELTKHDFRGTEDDSACVLELGGKITYTIPLKTKAGHTSGSIALTCNAEITSFISAGGEFRDDEYADLHLTNTTTTMLSFDMDFNLSYSYASEEHYLVHKNTQTIHTATCRIANKETNPANLRKLTAQELSELYNGDKETMRKHECKVCLAVTGLDGSAYVYNKNTGVLHCMNCLHVKDIKDCNLYTLYPDNTIGFEPCEDCRPQDRQTEDFDKRMLNAIKGSDWEKQVASFQEMLGDSIGSPKPSVDKDPKLSVPFNVFGVFNITIGVDPVFEFDMKASANFTLTASTKNEYGIRNEGKGFKPYNNEKAGDSKDTVKISFTGEADAKFGIQLSVIAHPVGLEKAAFIRINGQVGLYGHFSGIFSMEATAGGDTDTYCAARLEAGLYLKLDGYWKILWFDDPFEIIEETRLPLFKWGYDRMYYAFEEEEVEWVVDNPDALVTLLYLPEKMNAKYLDLKSMEYETGTIKPSLIGDNHFNITVDIQNEDGSPCDFLLYNEQLGTIVKKWGAPKYFTAIITVRVTPKVQIDSVNDFWNSQTKDKVYGCDLDPLVIALKAEEKKEQRLLTQVNIYDESGTLTGDYAFHYDGDFLTGITTHRYGEYPYESSTVLEYDTAGRLISNISSNTGMPGMTSGSKYTYNSAGLLSSSYHWDGGASEITYEYDSAGKRSRAVESYDTGKTITEYNYDEDGVLSSAIRTTTIFESDTKTETIVYRYDSQNRISQISRTGGYSDSLTTYSYQYQLFGLYEYNDSSGASDVALFLDDANGYTLYSFFLSDPVFYVDEEGYISKVVDTKVYSDEVQTYVFYYDGVAAEATGIEWNGHFYKLFSNCSTWDEAKIYCESLGGHLATITSQEENDFVFNYVLSCGLESAYFGLSDAEDEGVWEWITGEQISFTNWANGEPNNENGNEDYGMFYYQFTTGKWNDGNFGQGTFNDGNPIYFICEWDAEKDENTSTNWQKTYRDFIIQDKQNSNYSDFTDYTSYELIYLDDDSVPELWINYGIYASGCRLLSYNDGKLMNEHMQAGGLTFAERSGRFNHEWGHMGLFSDTIYALENGVLTTVAQGSFNCVDENGYPTNVSKDYEWNDIPVTKEQYEQHLEEYIDSDTALTTGSEKITAYSYEEISEYLRAFK